MGGRTSEQLTTILAMACALLFVATIALGAGLLDARSDLAVVEADARQRRAQGREMAFLYMRPMVATLQHFAYQLNEAPESLEAPFARFDTARDLLEGPAGPVDPTVPAALNRTHHAAAGLTDAAGIGVLTIYNLPRETTGLGDALERLAVALRDGEDAAAHAENVTGLAARVANATAELARGSADIVNATFDASADPPRLTVTLAGRAPTHHPEEFKWGGAPWALDACRHGGGDGPSCVSTARARDAGGRYLITAPADAAVLDNHTLEMRIPNATGAHTMDVLVRSRVGGTAAWDGLVIAFNNSIPSRDLRGDHLAVCHRPPAAPSKCRAPVALALSLLLLDEDAFRNGTLQGTVVLENVARQGDAMDVLAHDPMPDVSVFATVRDAVTGEEVPRHRSSFDEGPRYLRNSAIQPGGSREFDVTFDGEWLVEPNRTYEVVLTYQPWGDDAEAKRLWSGPTRTMAHVRT